MASIRSKHTVPLLGIMFGVQGQEDALGLNIGTLIIPLLTWLQHSPEFSFQEVPAGCRANTRLNEWVLVMASLSPAFRS